MKDVVVDTNVLISFVTDRNAEQQARAAELFEAAAAGELRLILHQAVISELVYVLGNLYQQEAVDIAGLLQELLATPGIATADEVSWNQLWDFWPERFPDFADALLAGVAREKRYDAVATFDQRFIRRLRRGGWGVYWGE